MAFRLCEAIGCPHPDFLPDELSSAHLVEWAEYWAGQHSEGVSVFGHTSEEIKQQKLLAAIKAAKGSNG